MSELTKLLDGSVDEVKAAITGLSGENIASLVAAEKAGKNRRGVIDALNAAAGTANIPPATTIDPSGAPDQVVPDVDMTHPAIDANPRAGTTELQNRIDMNDPTVAGADAVAAQLARTRSDQD